LDILIGNQNLRLAKVFRGRRPPGRRSRSSLTPIKKTKIIASRSKYFAKFEDFWRELLVWIDNEIICEAQGNFGGNCLSFRPKILATTNEISWKPHKSGPFRVSGGFVTFCIMDRGGAADFWQSMRQISFCISRKYF
jgi:hypothetical protein